MKNFNALVHHYDLKDFDICMDTQEVLTAVERLTKQSSKKILMNHLFNDKEHKFIA
jgi:hypothetical protein